MISTVQYGTAWADKDAEIACLRAELESQRKAAVRFESECESLRTDNDRLRAALQEIVSEAESDDGLTAWDGSDIARAALNGIEK